MYEISFHYISEFSIFIGVLISMIRLSSISTVYYPFIICLAVGFINEILSVYLHKTIHANAANNNVYLSSRNLKKSKVITADQLSTYDVLNAGTLLLTTGSLKTLEEALAK